MLKLGCIKMILIFPNSELEKQIPKRIKVNIPWTILHHIQRSHSLKNIIKISM